MPWVGWGRCARPENRAVKKVLKKWPQGLCRHADSASLGADLKLIQWAMGVPKIGSKKLDDSSFYAMHRFEVTGACESPGCQIELSKECVRKRLKLLLSHCRV